MAITNTVLTIHSKTKYLLHYFSEFNSETTSVNVVKYQIAVMNTVLTINLKTDST